MTKNLILINFGVDFIIEIVNFRALKNYRMHHTIILVAKIGFLVILAQFPLRLYDLCWIFVGFDGTHKVIIDFKMNLLKYTLIFAEFGPWSYEFNLVTLRQDENHQLGRC